MKFSIALPLNRAIRATTLAAVLLIIGASGMPGCVAVATSLVTNAVTSPDLWATLLAPRGLGGPYRESTEFYKKADWKGLEVHATAALAANPTSPDWMVIKGYAMVLQNKFEEPVALMQRAHEINPEDIHAMNLWAAALRGLVASGAPGKSANSERAIMVLEKASRIDTTSAATFYLLGESYAEQKSWVKASQVFEEAVRLAPESSLVWFGAGQAYKAQGDLEKFSAALDVLRRIDPEKARELAR